MNLAYLKCIAPCLAHLVVSHLMFLGIHHAQHWQPTCADKAYNQHCCQHQKNDVEDRRIVPLDALGDGNDIAVLGNDTKHPEQELDNISCCRPVHIECH